MDENPAGASRRRPTLLMAVHSAKPAGAQLVALGQAEALSRDFELVIALGNGALRPRFARLGRLIRAPTRLPVWGASASRWALEIARAAPDAVRLAAVIRRNGVRAVIANSSVLVAPVLAARLARVPVIVHVQEAPKSVAARNLLRFHGALADTVVAISTGIVEALGPARATVLLNPVGIALPPLRARRERPPDAPLHLVVVGTIDRHKRQDLAIAALGHLVGRGLDARLSLVGPDSDVEYANRLRHDATAAGIAERVAFAGQCDDVLDRIAAADVLVLPAGEVTPLVLMEAMAVGTPVIAARMGSIADVVGEDGASGVLVPRDDPEAIANAVARLAEDPACGCRLAAAGRRRVEERFDERRSHERLRLEVERLLT
jgi:glycosyltransferase involved in cell wall biosynthesis